jgi:hypothetical protein
MSDFQIQNNIGSEYLSVGQYLYSNNTNPTILKNNYDYLIGTIWIVPVDSTVAYTYETFNEIFVKKPIIVQVVWVITEVLDGYYIFGDSYSYLNSYKHTKIAGMIDPTGGIQFNFQSISGMNDTQYTTGQIFNFIKFSNDERPNLYEKTELVHMQVQIDQKSTPVHTQYTMHNSYMVQVVPGNIYYKYLPGTETFNDGKFLSVPEFISKCIESS